MTRKGGWPETGFGSELQKVRTEKGLTQKTLGEMVGLHPNTVAKLERGEQEPAWPLVVAICKALGVTCETFFPTGQPPVDPTPEEPARPTGKKK